jgi:hypothetical protein
MWPLRKEVSSGSFTKMAADEAQNFTKENVVGDAWLSIMKRVLNTRGVDRVRIGWMSEWSIVGRRTKELQK